MFVLAIQMMSLGGGAATGGPSIPSGRAGIRVPRRTAAAGGAQAPVPASAAAFNPASIEKPRYDTSRRAVTAASVGGGSLRDIVSNIMQSNADLLSHSPARPSTVTMVTGIWNLGRGTMQTSQQWNVLRRPFNHYVQGLKQFLAYPFPKVLFCDAESCAAAKPLVDESMRSGGGETKLVLKSLDDVARDFPNFDLVQDIRGRNEWKLQSDWVTNSPQAQLPFFNPVVMSKVAFTRDAARWNPFHTDGFLWLDVSHLCHNPAKLRMNKQDNIVRYLDKFLTTFHDYAPTGSSVLGFTKTSFNSYLNRNPSDESALMLARGGVLGGTREYLEVAAAVFDSVLAATLNDGFMGTDQNVLTIMDFLAPDLFHHFEATDSKATCAVFAEFLNPPMNPLVDGWETRGLNCKWLDNERQVACFDGLVRCPDHVTPVFLEEAQGQGVCRDEPNNYFCRVVCTRDGEVSWAGEPCPNDGVSPCPPWPRTKLPNYTPESADAQAGTGTVAGPHPEPQAQQPVPEPQAPAGGVRGVAGGPSFTGAALLERADPENAKVVRDIGGFDLRGLGCEVKDGVEVCFQEDAEGREKCPPHVTSALLTAGAGQYLCQQDTPGYYCTASCGLGVTINWHAHETKWCEENVDRCPPRPAIEPLDTYALKPWSEVIRLPMQCQRPAVMPKISVLILAYKETESLSASLKTYEDAQFLENVDETILYLNARNAEMEAVAEKYTKPPYNVKLMGDGNNYGIATALNWLFGNATNDHVLFLEKDFRLVESLDCALEQLATGVSMLNEGTAHVVRYRSRHNPGRPNWARILYQGHEDDVFKNQPNLLCNFFHWVDSPDKRWPDQFWPCWKGTDGEVDRSKVFYCTKAEFCNWTNNPVLISRKWWHDEYEVNFPNFKNIDPYNDVELYMNWEPNAWNNRPWIVAEGEGMFRHMDVKKWGA